MKYHIYISLVGLSKFVQIKNKKMIKRLISIYVALIFSFSSLADEGMWLPQLLNAVNEKEMQELGLKLSKEDLYDINNSSLKDAIVSLSWGSCTGEMISEEGLMLTNHHCAYDDIQQHSSLSNDLLENGFWAMNRGDELPNDGLTASFLINIENVTEQILEHLSDEMTEMERRRKIREVSQSITSKITDSTHFNAVVKSFYAGNEFYVFTYETFSDVRLVGAPPSSIGSFGGDTDNWMWPRHTGDFALYRIYCGQDGKPAEYSIDNVPYAPKHHLPIQLQGVENGDYSMIFGYPGSTDRYLTSYGIKQALEITNPTIVDIRSEKLAIMKAAMDIDKKTKIQYASKYASTSNYWKYYIGQSKGLNSMKVYDKKKSTEDDFTSWVLEDSLRKKKYGHALDLIESAYRTNKAIELTRIYLNEAIFSGAELMGWSWWMNEEIKALPKEEQARKIAIRKIKEQANDFYKDYNSSLDEELFAAMLEMYYYNVPKKHHASVFKRIENQLFGFKSLDFEWYAKNVYKRSIFTSKEKFFKFLEKPSSILLTRDPIYKTMISIEEKYMEEISSTRFIVKEELQEGERLFIAGLREMNSDENLYPDANSTMRITYGTVGDYNPGEAMHYDYYTTIDGVMQKEDSTNEEFVVSKKLKELYELGDYGRYADKDSNLRVNFISNNDITGGNSGSPVMNAWGELVGTAFDGNWEAMSGDIAFEKEIQRTISVDIRYILFIIDKYAGAGHLINEMTIAPIREEKMSAEELYAAKMENAVNDPNIIVKELAMKEYLGNLIPVMDIHSFSSAFDLAVKQWGSSKEVKFWWRGNIYTTEKRGYDQANSY